MPEVSLLPSHSLILDGFTKMDHPRHHFSRLRLSIGFAFVAALMLLLSGLSRTPLPSYRYVLIADRATQTWLFTTSTALQSLLTEAAVIVHPKDQVLVNGMPVTISATAPSTTAAALSNLPQIIRVQRAFHVQIIDGDTARAVSLVGDTVADALLAAKIALVRADQVEPALDTALSDNLTIRLYRAVEITIVREGQRFITRTSGKTVAAALAESGIALIDAETVAPSEQTAITPGLIIYLSQAPTHPIPTP